MALENFPERDEKRLLRAYKIICILEIFFIISTVSAQECYYDGNEFCIDQNDILSVDLLPGSFLFNDHYNVSKTVINETMDGSFDRALTEMEYHR